MLLKTYLYCWSLTHAVKDDQLALTGLSLPQLASIGFNWPQLTSAGFNWPQMALTYLIWPHLASTGISCPQLTSADLSWPHLISTGLDWPQLYSTGISWPQLASASLRWTQLVSAWMSHRHRLWVMSSISELWVQPLGLEYALSQTSELWVPSQSSQSHFRDLSLIPGLWVTHQSLSPNSDLGVPPLPAITGLNWRRPSSAPNSLPIPIQTSTIIYL